MIPNFDDFCQKLNTCGFSMGGGNAKGIYAVRRSGKSFEDAYECGVISNTAKRIYEIVSEDCFALHEIKALGGFGK